ncbi:MAG: hypothetical protein J3K34DRAFT_497300 [Monoraphidium minutum]|nr:MAG: hypothetical protein J3K34DRAFT_497300 [Monoraphidium minutum]
MADATALASSRIMEGAAAEACSGGSGAAEAPPPQLDALSGPALDALVCALEPRHRGALRLTCRRLCRAADAHAPRVAVASGLRPPALLELGRLCPRLRRAAGVAVMDGVSWGPPAPLPPGLAALTSLKLRLDEHTEYRCHRQGDASTADVLSALPALRELLFCGDLMFGTLGSCCSALERLELQSEDLGYNLEALRHYKNDPLIALTCMKMSGRSTEPMRMTAADVAAIGTVCPSLLELDIGRYVGGDYAILGEVVAPPPLRHLTRLGAWNILPDDAAPLREWAPALRALELSDPHPTGEWPRGISSPHPALRRLAYDAAPDFFGGYDGTADSWMLGVSQLTGLTALELRVRGTSRGGASRDEREGPFYLRRWALAWPRLRSLTLEFVGPRVPAMPLVAALGGAPLAATLAELRLAGVALGTAEDTARTLPRAFELPCLNSFDLWLRPESGGGSADDLMGALRTLAAPAAGPRLPAGGGQPRVTLGVPLEWMCPQGPLAWAEVEGLATSLLTVVVD